MNTYLYILVMAATTYLIRVLPLTLIRKPIRSVFLRSFLFYVPYVTLSVMTFPAIMNATQSPIAPPWSSASSLHGAGWGFSPCRSSAAHRSSHWNFSSYENMHQKKRPHVCADAFFIFTAAPLLLRRRNTAPFL